MTMTIGILIAPSMQHRIVENGADTKRIHRIAGQFASAALLPFGISLGLDIFIVFDHISGTAVAVTTAVTFGGIASLLWLVLGFALRESVDVPNMSQQQRPTPLPTRIDQMLTEARVIVPGAQALLGFQLMVTFTRGFGELAAAQKLVHLVALCCVALAVVVLMTPAALHRIAFRGQDCEAFLAIGSRFVIAAPMALAIALAGDMQVAIVKATGSSMLATGAAVASFLTLVGLWFAIPLLLRAKRTG
jgi:hypothetical protein